jgi:hypothetical protein
VTTDDLVVLLRATDPRPIVDRAESRELRRILAVLLIWIAGREELLELYHAEAERRWAA